MKSTLVQHASGHRRLAFANWSRLRRQTAIRSRPWWGRRTCRWASLRRFVKACAEIIPLCKPTVSSAVGMLVSDDPSGEEVGCGGHGLRRQLEVLPNSLKCWRRLMVEKLNLNSLATALADIPAVCITIAHSLKTWNICGIVLRDKALYCPQHKEHLCNDHAVLISFLICHTCQVDGLFWQRINTH